MDKDHKITIHRVVAKDDLAAIAKSVVGSEWAVDNYMTDYQEKALKDIVSNPDYILLLAYVSGKIAGIVLAMRLLKPDGQHWLYIDEVDTHPDFRRKGVAKSLLTEVLSYAKDLGVGEVWAGTEPDNSRANHLYKGFHPNEIETFVGYTYKIQRLKE